MKRPDAAGTVDDAPPPERTGTAVTGHGAAAGWLTTCSWEDLKPTDGSNKQALEQVDLKVPKRKLEAGAMQPDSN